MRKLNGETYNRLSCWYVQLMLCSNVNILHDMYSMLVYHFPTLLPEQRQLCRYSHALCIYVQYSTQTDVHIQTVYIHYTTEHFFMKTANFALFVFWLFLLYKLCILLNNYLQKPIYEEVEWTLTFKKLQMVATYSNRMDLNQTWCELCL